MYCPCCRENFQKDEKFCIDCGLPLVEGVCPPQLHRLCDCDDSPLGKEITNRFKDEDPDAAAEVASLLRHSRDMVPDLDPYIEKLLEFNL